MSLALISEFIFDPDLFCCFVFSLFACALCIWINVLIWMVFFRRFRRKKILSHETTHKLFDIFSFSILSHFYNKMWILFIVLLELKKINAKHRLSLHIFRNKIFHSSTPEQQNEKNIAGADSQQKSNDVWIVRYLFNEKNTQQQSQPTEISFHCQYIAVRYSRKGNHFRK